MNSDDDGNGVVSTLEQLAEIVTMTWGVCYHRTRNIDQANDAFGETALAAFKQKDRLIGKKRSRVRRWCFCVADNKSVDLMRKKWRHDSRHVHMSDAGDISSRSLSRRDYYPIDIEQLYVIMLQANSGDARSAAFADFIVEYLRSHDGELPKRQEIGAEFFEHLGRTQSYENAKAAWALVIYNTRRLMCERGIDLPADED